MKNTPIDWVGRALRKIGNDILTHRGWKGNWIDVGAHHGELTIGYARGNPGLTIYAFEPNLRAASSLFGRSPNYIVIPMAVAETDGCSQFRLNSCDNASSLLVMDETARRCWKGGEALREESVISVPTIRLDTFMGTVGLSRVDYLKIDTQGNDLGVIRSAGKRLRDILKITLEVDVSPKRLYQGSSSKEEVVSFLQDSGFTLVATEPQSHRQEENLTFECFSSR